MYRKHQAEKKSRISLNNEQAKANTSEGRPSSTQNKQLGDQIQDSHQNIQAISHPAVLDQEKGGSKTTAADRAALEKEQ